MSQVKTKQIQEKVESNWRVDGRYRILDIKMTVVTEMPLEHKKAIMELTKICFFCNEHKNIPQNVKDTDFKGFNLEVCKKRKVKALQWAKANGYDKTTLLYTALQGIYSAVKTELSEIKSV